MRCISIKYLLILFLICVGCSSAEFTSQNESISQTLSPKTAIHLLKATVRVTGGNTIVGTNIGTGVVVYSQRRATNVDPRYYTYILTCAHVVNRYKNLPLSIECFQYADSTSITSIASYSGEVVAVDRKRDIAVIQIISAKPFPEVVAILSPSNFYNHPIYQAAYVIGCGLGQRPFITNGNISSYLEEKDPDAHVTVDFAFQVTAPTIYGNSGGGVYDAEGHLMGLIQTISLVDTGIPCSHIAHANPIWNIALFLMENRLGFIIGLNDSNIDEFFRFKNNLMLYEKKEQEDRDFRKDLLEALQKLVPVAPITSDIAPINSITMPLMPELPQTHRRPPKNWH